MDGVAVPVQLSKLVTVANACSNRWRNHWQICENGINLIQRRLKLFLKKISGGAPVRLFNELGCDKFTLETDADKYIHLSICRLEFSNINVE
jgi:hypothetical protein